MVRFRLLELQQVPQTFSTYNHPWPSLKARRPTAFDDYSDAYKKSQDAEKESNDELESSGTNFEKDMSAGLEKESAKLGKEQSGEEEAMKINDIGKSDKAKCKDGCRLGDGAGFPIGPPPPGERSEGFGGATGNGSEGVVFPTGGQIGQTGQGGQGGQGLGGAGGAGAGGAGGAGGLGVGGGGEARVPQEWIDAETAKEADDLAVELVAKEAKRTHRSFEDVANMGTDDPANDPYASLPRPPYTADVRFEDSEGKLEDLGWPPPGASDKWGGPPVQLPVNLARGTMLMNWTSFLLAFLAPTPRLHCKATSFEQSEGPQFDQSDDLDDTPDDINDIDNIYEQEPPPPGAKDKWGGPAMQQADDMEGPSAEGNCRSLLMASICPTLPRRRKRDRDFL